ncbi:MAG: hypothetical protein IPP55_11590 [Anaerolineales bacterium]|nr:hypothetical protein [Anaerolineales bacterium]
MSDGVHLEVDEFNRKVITKPFNTVVQVSGAGDRPYSKQKTLIFLCERQTCGPGRRLVEESLSRPIWQRDDDAAVKITGTV